MMAVAKPVIARDLQKAKASILAALQRMEGQAAAKDLASALGFIALAQAELGRLSETSA
jgi:hypothetical protein